MDLSSPDESVSKHKTKKRISPARPLAISIQAWKQSQVVQKKWFARYLEMGERNSYPINLILLISVSIFHFFFFFLEMLPFNEFYYLRKGTTDERRLRDIWQGCGIVLNGPRPDYLEPAESSGLDTPNPGAKKILLVLNAINKGR